MPELPEVETIRRDVDPHVRDRTIRRARVLDTGNAARVIRRHLARQEVEAPLAGSRIRALDRHGKYLQLRLDSGLVLVFHLGMSGRLLLAEPGAELARHTHFVLDLGADMQLRFVDPRAFGEVFLAVPDAAGRLPQLAGLGPDPLTDGVPYEHLAGAFRTRRTRVKPLLMDQSFIAGLGNIYTDEIQFLAGLRHSRPTPRVTRAEIRRIEAAIPQVLHEAIGNRGTSMADEQYRDAFGAAGSHRKALRVYGRENLPCVVCGTPIRRGRWANRSSFYCPRCQR